MKRNSIDDDNAVDSLGMEMHHNNSSNGSRSSGYDHHHHHNHSREDRLTNSNSYGSGYRSSNATVTVVPHSFRRNPMYLPSPANSNCNTATLTNAIGTSVSSSNATNNTSVLTSNMIKSGLYPVSGEKLTFKSTCYPHTITISLPVLQLNMILVLNFVFFSSHSTYDSVI